jgi:hypothetical protein
MVMKKLFYLAIVFCAFSCASVSPVGTWNYSITGTPQGDYSGVLNVTKADKKNYSAVMKSDAGDLKFNKFSFDGKTKKSTGDFDYQGMNVWFDTALKENEMTGNVSVQGMNFPFKATRKK